MFALATLWKPLRGPLKTLLGKRFKALGGRFRSLLDAMVDELAESLKAQYFDTGLWRQHAKVRVEHRKSGERLLGDAFPLDTVAESEPVLRDLKRRIANNLKLDAQRNALGVPDADWEKIVDGYARHLLRHGAAFAFRRMARRSDALYAGQAVIDLAEKEPIRVAGRADYRDLVVLAGGSDLDAARRLWRRRNGESYEFQDLEYDPA